MMPSLSGCARSGRMLASESTACMHRRHLSDQELIFLLSWKQARSGDSLGSLPTNQSRLRRGRRRPAIDRLVGLRWCPCEWRRRGRRWVRVQLGLRRRLQGQGQGQGRQPVRQFLGVLLGGLFCGHGKGRDARGLQGQGQGAGRARGEAGEGGAGRAQQGGVPVGR